MKKIDRFLALVVVAILFVACSNPVSSSSDGTDTVFEKTVILQEGLGGYSGTEDTTIYAEESDWTIVGDAPTASQMTSIYNSNVNPRYRAIALVRFDVSGLISNMLSDSETCEANIEVMKASVELNGTIGPSTALTYFNPMDLTAPSWTESDANWTEASSGIAWTGVADDVPVLQDISTGNGDSREGWANSAISQSVYFNLPTEDVKEWVCDASKNQGFAIRNAGPNGASRFYTSEFPLVWCRPKLIMVLQKI
jgi:hypothetical protein